MAGQCHRLRFQLVRRGDAADEAEVQGFLRRYGPAGEQHFHRLFGHHGAGYGHARGGAEQANLDARRGEGGGVGGHGNVASGDQLAAGGGGKSLYLGDDRLGQQADGFHHAGAGVKDGGVVVGAAVEQLVEVVAGAEYGALGADDHDAGGGVVGDFVQPFLQGGQGAGGEGVAALGVVEGEDGDAVFIDVVVSDGQGFNFVRRGGAGLVAFHSSDGDGVAGRGEEFHQVRYFLRENVHHSADLAGFEAIVRQVVG